MDFVGAGGALSRACGPAPHAFVAPMSVPVLAGRIGAALTVAIGTTKLAIPFVLNMFVLFAGAGRTVAGGVAEAAFGLSVNQLQLNASDKRKEWDIDFGISGNPFLSTSLTSKILWEDVCRHELRCGISARIFILVIDHCQVKQT